jgi:CheY-like chemotaxis protein
VVTTGGLVIVVLAGLGWWQGARIDVAGDRLPVLYREEVARTAIIGPGIDATLAIQQKHIQGDARLRVVGVTDVRLATERLPATIELRIQSSSGSDAYGVLAHSEVSDARRATGTTRTLYEAPFPPLAPRERATYRVWLHVESATGPVESPVLLVQVTDRPEGQRARDRPGGRAPQAWLLLPRLVAAGGSDVKNSIRQRRGLPQRVLVVEDDADTRQMLVSAIADGGFEAIPALDGQHALRTALAVEPSAIVLDLMLPGVNGEEFVRAYRDQSKTVAPIVVVSARPDAVAVGKKIGARAVLLKPLDIGELLARLNATMRVAPA